MNMNKLMKQAQKMQKQMLEMQEKLKDIETEASVGGGMITVKMNGAFELLNIDIDKEIIESNDTDMLKDLIISAVNEVRKQVEEKNKVEMSKITGGMNLPGM